MYFKYCVTEKNEMLDTVSLKIRFHYLVAVSLLKENVFVMLYMDQPEHQKAHYVHRGINTKKTDF